MKRIPSHDPKHSLQNSGKCSTKKCSDSNLLMFFQQITDGKESCRTTQCWVCQIPNQLHKVVYHHVWYWIHKLCHSFFLEQLCWTVAAWFRSESWHTDEAPGFGMWRIGAVLRRQSNFLLFLLYVFHCCFSLDIRQFLPGTRKDEISI